MLKQNVLANVLGGLWTAGLSLLIIPVQVHFLGVEAYGLIAFLASLQILASVFDLGLSPAITRQVAMDTSSDHGRSAAVVRAVSKLYWPVGLVLGAALFLAAPGIAAHWLNLGSIPVPTGTRAIQLGALALAIRWPVSFYAGVIAGRQRFAPLNAVKAGAAAVTLLGGVAVILVTRSLLAYMTWLPVAALLEVAAYTVLSARVVPWLRPGAGAEQGAPIWRFATGMNAITILSMVLTQSDRLLISKLLPVAVLGYYALAYNVVYGLTLIPSFATTALFPAFVESHSSQGLEALRSRYLTSTQVLLYAYNLPIWLLAFFGGDLLALVTSPATAQRAAPLLALLGIGFLFNAASSLAYTVSIGTGNTRLPVVVNVAAVILYVPALTAAVLLWGGTGAAIAWLVLNALYIPTLLRIVHRQILGISTLRWLATTLLPFVLLAVVTLGGARLFQLASGWTAEPVPLIAAAAGAAVYVAAGFWLLRAPVRTEIVHSLGALPLAAQRR